MSLKFCYVNSSAIYDINRNSLHYQDPSYINGIPLQNVTGITLP